MKIEVKKLEGVRREIKFEIPKERVSKTLEEVYRDLGKVAKIKGFRPGMAPRHLVEMHHGRLAQEETIKKLIPEVYDEGIEKEKLDPIDLPEIHDVDFKDGKITFTAKIDVRPEIKIKDYKGLKIQRKSSKVTEEEINKTLEFFQKGRGGEEKEVKVDDAFAKGLGYPTLDDFKKSLTRQLEMDKDRHNRMDIENQIVEELIKNTKMSVPESLVKKQLHHRLSDLAKRYKQQGMKDDEIAKKEPEWRKELEPAAEKDIQVFLILNEIAKLENIEIKQGENMPVKVLEFLMKEAKWEEAK